VGPAPTLAINGEVLRRGNKMNFKSQKMFVLSGEENVRGVTNEPIVERVVSPVAKEFKHKGDWRYCQNCDHKIEYWFKPRETEKSDCYQCSPS